ncbi:MAG: diguanylate cyclase, partial [Magnetococcales bacterium]|nr:diguanylate cyclase [Magnetococcales bacterium]
ETGLERLSLKRQLEVALDIVFNVSWLSIESRGCVFLNDEASGALKLTAHRGLAPELQIRCASIQIGECLCGTAAENKSTLFSAHLDDEHVIRYPGIQPHGHYCAPILSQQKLLGVLNLYVADGHRSRSEEEAFLATYCGALAGLIDLRQTQRKLREEQIFSSTILRTAPVLVMVLSPQGEIVLFNKACQDLTGFDEETVKGKKSWEWFVPKKDRQSVEEAFHKLSQGRFPNTYEHVWLDHAGRKRLISWRNAISHSSDGVIHHIIATGIDITEKRESEEHLRHMASHDALTGLPNRISFMDHMQVSIAQAKRNDSMLAVLFLDLDRFKTVNDTMGHEVGDHLLMEVAQRIRGVLRASDMVARLGGDEFTVLLDGLTGPDRVESIGRKLISEICTPFDIQGNRCQIGTSIGAALSPMHGEEPELLLKKADDAMYKVKHSGRNDFLFYSDSVE